MCGELPKLLCKRPLTPADLAPYIQCASERGAVVTFALCFPCKRAAYPLNNAEEYSELAGEQLVVFEMLAKLWWAGLSPSQANSGKYDAHDFALKFADKMIKATQANPACADRCTDECSLHVHVSHNTSRKDTQSRIHEVLNLTAHGSSSVGPSMTLDPSALNGLYLEDDWASPEVHVTHKELAQFLQEGINRRKDDADYLSFPLIQPMWTHSTDCIVAITPGVYGKEVGASGVDRISGPLSQITPCKYESLHPVVSTNTFMKEYTASDSTMQMNYNAAWPMSVQVRAKFIGEGSGRKEELHAVTLCSCRGMLESTFKAVIEQLVFPLSRNTVTYKGKVE